MLTKGISRQFWLGSWGWESGVGVGFICGWSRESESESDSEFSVVRSRESESEFKVVRVGSWSQSRNSKWSGVNVKTECFAVGSVLMTVFSI